MKNYPKALLQWLSKRQIKVPSAVVAGDVFKQDDFARSYAARTAADPLHAYYERHEMLRLLGDSTGKALLLAGCGPGHYHRLLEPVCQQLSALDASPAMVDMAKAVAIQPGLVITHDLQEPLPYAEQSFDTVISPLTFHYIADWEVLMQEMHRVLKPGGTLLFSTLSPVYSHKQANTYLNISETRTRFAESKELVTAYHRPFSAMHSALTKAGFTVTAVAEPIPSHPTIVADQKLMDSFLQNPIFLFFKVQKATVLP